MSRKSEAEKRRQAFESAIRSVMFAPKVYGSLPEKQTDPIIGSIDSTIRDSESVENIKKLLELKAELVAEEESQKAKERARDQIKLRPDEMDVIVNIALDLLSGHDPRQLLGIKPKRGKRVNLELDQFEMDIALYFWGLRKRAEGMRAKAAANEVSRASGVSPLRVEKIARKRKEWATAIIELNPHMNHVEQAKSMMAFMLAFSANQRAAEDKTASGVTPIPHK